VQRIIFTDHTSEVIIKNFVFMDCGLHPWQRQQRHRHFGWSKPFRPLEVRYPRFAFGRPEEWKVYLILPSGRLETPTPKISQCKALLVNVVIL
jgi:hypothetical protein